MKINDLFEAFLKSITESEAPLLRLGSRRCHPGPCSLPPVTSVLGGGQPGDGGEDGLRAVPATLFPCSALSSHLSFAVRKACFFPTCAGELCPAGLRSRIEPFEMRRAGRRWQWTGHERFSPFRTV